jgi:hypothetical protein
MEKYVNIVFDIPILLPPDMLNWVPRSHLIHFVIDAIESVDTSMAQMTNRLILMPFMVTAKLVLIFINAQMLPANSTYDTFSA